MLLLVGISGARTTPPSTKQYLADGACAAFPGTRTCSRLECGSQPVEVAGDALAHLAGHERRGPAKEAAWRAGRVDGHERALRRVLQLVADEHGEGPVDLQLDQPVRLELGYDIPVTEGPSEKIWPCARLLRQAPAVPADAVDSR